MVRKVSNKNRCYYKNNNTHKRCKNKIYNHDYKENMYCYIHKVMYMHGICFNCKDECNPSSQLCNICKSKLW